MRSSMLLVFLSIRLYSRSSSRFSIVRFSTRILYLVSSTCSTWPRRCTTCENISSIRPDSRKSPIWEVSDERSR